MAKIFLDRLAKKYGFKPGQVVGENYRIIMQDIISQNSENIAKSTSRLSKEHWNQQLKKLGGDKKNFILPDIEEALPKRSVFIRKAAEHGNYISDTLRDDLTKKLRDSLDNFRTAKTDEPAFLRRRGTKAGTINPKLVKQFEQDIKNTFANYTKRDPKIGVPSNIKTIAVTEMRSTIDDMKEAYDKEFLKRNPQIRMWKRWLQNRSLSKKPRSSHAMVHGVEIPFDEKFDVPLEVKGVIVGSTPMSRPHDPSAPLEQIIGCHCDFLTYAVIDKKQK